MAMDDPENRGVVPVLEEEHIDGLVDLVTGLLVDPLMDLVEL